jgi:hypothetical protein
MVVRASAYADELIKTAKTIEGKAAIPRCVKEEGST